MNSINLLEEFLFTTFSVYNHLCIDLEGIKDVEKKLLVNYLKCNGLKLDYNLESNDYKYNTIIIKISDSDFSFILRHISRTHIMSLSSKKGVFFNDTIGGSVFLSKKILILIKYSDFMSLISYFSGHISAYELKIRIKNGKRN